MATRIKFADLVPIYRGMVHLHDETYKLTIDNELVRSSLALALHDNNYEDSGVAAVEGDYRKINIGDVFVLDISPPRVGLGIFAKNFSSYLNAPGAKLRERRNYYLLESGFHYPDDKSSPALVNKYRQILRLVQLLAAASHYLDESKEELVFYKSGRFFVPIKYDVHTITSLDFQVFEALEKFALDPYHKDHKLKMLGDNVCSILESISEEDRFEYVVKNLSDIYKRLQVSYELFVADHSYDKAVAEVDSYKVEAIARIHKALTDIQAQILGIPIATFVSLSQLKVTRGLNSQLAINSIIFLGVFVFCGLLVVFLLNQRATLNVIGLEAKRHNNLFKSKFKHDASIYEPGMSEVFRRLCWQYTVLYSIAVLVCLMLLVSTVYYLVHTRPIYDVFF